MKNTVITFICKHCKKNIQTNETLFCQKCRLLEPKGEQVSSFICIGKTNLCDKCYKEFEEISSKSFNELLASFVAKKTYSDGNS
jgi:predicted PP-loop superfamily ATPase